MITKKLKWIRNIMAFGAIWVGVFGTVVIAIDIEPMVPSLILLWLLVAIYLGCVPNLSD